jgi:hypothetical protein
MSTALNHDRHQRAIDAHFAGRGSRADEAALRAHLPTCARCQRRYERHLLLTRLDPRAPSAEDRLARGLGLGRRPRPRLAWGLPALAVGVVALALWWPRAGGPDGADFAARGPAPAPAVLVYTVPADGAVRPAGPRIARGDELAFAYTNPSGKRYLLVYGVDEHGHVYWFHPAWPVGAPPPSAVAARSGPGPHELPEAVRHRYDGHHLRITAALSDERLGVDAVERGGEILLSPFEGRGPVQVTTRVVEIAP